MKLSECPLPTIGIPQDVIDAAKKVEMDAETLVQLCIAHSVDAARSFLFWMASKLPSGK